MQHNKLLTGKVYILGDNIDTDLILTAEFLKINPSTAEGYAELGRLAMCGLPEDYPPFVDKTTGKSLYDFIVAGENFGCGSSREHAVMALGSSGIKAVIARSFARIFFRNCISTGELLPVSSSTKLNATLKTGDTITMDLDNSLIKAVNGETLSTTEPIGELSKIIDAGGLFSYARAIGKIA